MIVLMAAVALSLGCATMASAQQGNDPDLSLSTETPTPGAPVTVTVTNATPGDPVIVRLGVIDEATTVDASGAATVTIAAPDEPGEAIGTVQIGVVDLPFTVTVQSAVVPTETTTTTTTTTLPPPTTPPPVTGLDDTATLVGLSLALIIAGAATLAVARRPTTRVTHRGSVTLYRIVDDRNEGAGPFGR